MAQYVEKYDEECVEEYDAYDPDAVFEAAVKDHDTELIGKLRESPLLNDDISIVPTEALRDIIRATLGILYADKPITSTAVAIGEIAGRSAILSLVEGYEDGIRVHRMLDLLSALLHARFKQGQVNAEDAFEVALFGVARQIETITFPELGRILQAVEKPLKELKDGPAVSDYVRHAQFYWQVVLSIYTTTRTPAP